MDVKTLCLGALIEGDKTGYEIKRRFEDSFSHFFVAGYGSIYPALADLTRRRLVECTSVSQEKRPDKKVYSLTERGRDALIKELMAAPPRHKVRSEFLVLMVFAHLLPPAKVAEIADAMVAQWGAMLASIGDCLADEGEALAPGMRFAAGYGRAVLGAAKRYVEENAPLLIDRIKEEAAPSDAAD
jgi:DNA-binding PadR family transcriptional regulator